MAVHRTPALILRHTTDREHDRLISVLTPTRGLLRLRARGTKKSASKLGGAIEPVAEVDLQYADGRVFGQVTGCVVKNRFLMIRSDLISLVNAQWLCELVEGLTKPEQDDRTLYGWLVSELTAMESEISEPAGRRWAGLYRRAWKLIKHQGFLPTTETCAICHQPLDGQRKYLPASGFVHPAETKSGWPLSASTMDYLNNAPESRDIRQIFRELSPLIEQLTNQVIEKPLKSSSVLRAVMRGSRLSSGTQSIKI